MQMTFFTPCHDDTGIPFGAASFGIAGCAGERDDCVRSFAPELAGTVLRGSYAQCLAAVPAGPWQAGVVLLGNGGGENDFVRALAEKARCPLTGGAAAIDPVSGRANRLAGGGAAAVLLLRDPRWTVEVVSQNVHEILSEHTLTLATPRTAAAIDGQDAAAWYDARRKELGLSPEDFEHLTLCDMAGINAHLSLNDGKLTAGRDLETRMTLRYLAPDRAQSAIQAFYDDPDAAVFGCAGLKSTLTAPLRAGGLGLFLFGEVCTVDGRSDFGNLMLSKLRVIPA